MAIKATNKSATTHNKILMSSIQCTKCHSNRIMLNEQHYYHPQQLKEFLQEKVSHLFYGLEVSINYIMFHYMDTPLKLSFEANSH